MPIDFLLSMNLFKMRIFYNCYRVHDWVECFLFWLLINSHQCNAKIKAVLGFCTPLKQSILSFMPWPFYSISEEFNCTVSLKITFFTSKVYCRFYHSKIQIKLSQNRFWWNVNGINIFLFNGIGTLFGFFQ